VPPVSKHRPTAPKGFQKALAGVTGETDRLKNEMISDLDEVDKRMEATIAYIERSEKTGQDEDFCLSGKRRQAGQDLAQQKEISDASSPEEREAIQSEICAGARFVLGGRRKTRHRKRANRRPGPEKTGRAGAARKRGMLATTPKPSLQMRNSPPVGRSLRGVRRAESDGGQDIQ